MTIESDSSDKLSRWQLWRQDDNGVSILVGQYESQDLALEAMAQFESHHHKQTYWIVEEKPAGSIDQPRPKITPS